MPSEKQFAVREQAALWIARLHADDCNDTDRARFVQWMREDTCNANTFELLTDYWELGGGVPTQSIPATPAKRLDTHGFSLGRRSALALASAALIALVPMNKTARASRVLQASTGHTLRIALPDYGTCLLDSGSRMTLSEDGHRARLEHGQVLLSPESPSDFHLSVRNVTVRLSRQTSANVRMEQNCTDITALRGRILLRSGTTAARDIWIRTGQRFRIAQNGAVSIDYPNIEALLSWQTGRLIFRNTPLEEAVLEIRRYSQRQIILASPTISNMRLSGVYFVSQGEMFLRMLPRLLPLTLQEQGNVFIFRAL